MKTLNILKDMVTAACAPPEDRRLMWSELDDCVLMTPDSFVCYRLRAQDVPFVFKESRRSDVPKDLWKKILGMDYVLAQKIYVVQEEANDRLEKRVIFDEKVAVRERLTKNFDKHAEYYIAGSKDAVLVFEQEEPAGFIMPVRWE